MTKSLDGGFIHGAIGRDRKRDYDRAKYEFQILARVCTIIPACHSYYIVLCCTRLLELRPTARRSKRAGFAHSELWQVYPLFLASLFSPESARIRRLVCVANRRTLRHRLLPRVAHHAADTARRFRKKTCYLHNAANGRTSFEQFFFSVFGFLPTF